MVKNTFIIFILLFSLNSCEKKCTLPPIPEETFDLRKLNKIEVFGCEGKFDQIKLVETYNHYEKSSFKGPMEHRECEHYKSYEVEFKGERILVSIRKTDNEILELDLLAFGTCSNFSNEKKIIENDLLLNKEYVFERNSDCPFPDNKIIKVVLKGFKIKSITTSDNKTWTHV